MCLPHVFVHSDSDEHTVVLKHSLSAQLKAENQSVCFHPHPLSVCDESKSMVQQCIMMIQQLTWCNSMFN